MTIEWTEPALRDLESIRDYIRRDSKYYADRFIERIVGAVESLTSFPQVGRVVPEANNPALRELLYANYRIMYRVEPDRVLLIAVVHAVWRLGRERGEALGRRLMRFRPFCIL